MTKSTNKERDDLLGIIDDYDNWNSKAEVEDRIALLKARLDLTIAQLNITTGELEKHIAKTIWDRRAKGGGG